MRISIDAIVALRTLIAISRDRDKVEDSVKSSEQDESKN